MPRSANADAMAAALTLTGQKPIVLVQIGANFYSTHALAGAKNNIVSVDGYQCARRHDSMGTVGVMSFTFNDYDGLMKAIFDSTILETLVAAAWQCFEGLTADKNLLLIAGKVASPIEWDETNRTIKLSIESRVRTDTAGFAPTQADFDDIADDAAGTPWPMMFGSCAHVPCVRARKQREGTLLTPLYLWSNVFTRTSDDRDINLEEACFARTVSDIGVENDRIYVDNADKFPQDTAISLSVDGVIFKGSFHEGIFNVTQANAPKYVNQPFAARVVGGTDENNPFVAYLPLTFTGDLTGHHVYLNSSSGKTFYNFCVKQQDYKAYFQYPWRNPILTSNTRNRYLVSSSDTIKGAYYSASQNGLEEKAMSEIYRLKTTLKDRPLPTDPVRNPLGPLIRALEHIRNAPESFWLRPAGTKVRIYGVDDPDIYIASCIELTEIYSVYGRRQTRLPDGTEVKVFEPIPTSYFEIQLASDFIVNGQHASGLLFYKPLSEYKDEKWDDSVWVSGTSTVGPDVAEIINFLLTTYTDLTIGNMEGTVDECHFAYFQVTDALQLAQEIAFQARCALRIDSGVAQLLPLGVHQPEVMTFDYSNIDAESVVLTQTDLQDVKTRFLARWSESYKHRPSPSPASAYTRINFLQSVDIQEHVGNKIERYVQNTGIYGDIKDEFEVYIYNNSVSVFNTVAFWGRRRSNLWKRITFRTYLPALILQPFDYCTLSFPTGVLSNLNGMPVMVEDLKYDPKTLTITVSGWIPSRVGSGIVDTGVWPDE